MNLFSSIKEQIHTLDVISEFVTLKKAGLYWKGNCPFHSEKTASFTVSPHREIFYCFGCQTGGDIITFISKVEHCSTLEAAKYLIDRYRLVVPEELLAQTKDAQSGQEKDRYWKLCELVGTLCHDYLIRSPLARTYLAKRAVSDESIQRFKIGYFPGGLRAIQGLIEYVKKHNFLALDLVNAHILVQGSKVLYSPFEERIMFPIFDHLGRAVGFGGRIFRDTDERAKYYNSREHALFNKGSLLFGLNVAKDSLQKKEFAFLVEGYTDCIAMSQAGYQNTIATLGTACTIQHLKQLSRYVQKIYIMYDGDKAGQQAIIRLTELCWQTNLELKVIQLPPSDDPASFLHTHGSLTPLQTKAYDIFEFYVATLGAQHGTKNVHEKVKVVRKILDIIAKLDDTLKQDVLLQRASSLFDIPFESLQMELRKSAEKVRSASVEPPPAEPRKDHKLTEVPILEKKIFSVIINNAMVMSDSDESYLLEYLAPPLQHLLREFKKVREQIPEAGFADFFDNLTEPEQQALSQLMMECETYEITNDFDQLLAQYQKQQWKTFVDAIKYKLAQAQKDKNEEQIKKILSDFHELKKRLIQRGLI